MLSLLPSIGMEESRTVSDKQMISTSLAFIKPYTRDNLVAARPFKFQWQNLRAKLLQHPGLDLISPKCWLCYKAKLTFCSCFLQQKQKSKMAAKKWTDIKTFQFRNDLLWTGLEGNYFLWTKTFSGNKSIVYVKFYSLSMANWLDIFISCL